MKTIMRAAFTSVLVAVGCCSTVWATDFPENGREKMGSLLILSTDAYGFKPASKPTENERRCAGDGSTFTIEKVGSASQDIRFYHINPATAGGDTCPAGSPSVDLKSIYIIDAETDRTIRAKVSGIATGTLVVPFKFRMGSDRKIVSSSTIAPYLGYRSRHFQTVGNEVIPVIAAGLALVPIHDPTSNTTETKAAFSTAFGLTLRTIQNEKFSAGILFGKDFLSNADKKIDPSVNKMWFSVWIGFNN